MFTILLIAAAYGGWRAVRAALESLRGFVLEETYEVLDAIDRGDHDDLRGEIGDFLFEGVFLAQIETDAKLRRERERTDEELLDRSSAVNEDADHVIDRARERARHGVHAAGPAHEHHADRAPSAHHRT